MNNVSLWGSTIVASFMLKDVVPSGSIVWTTDAHMGRNNWGWQLCRNPPSNQSLRESFPWDGAAWTCKHTGEPCELPIDKFFLVFDTCTLFTSDFYDDDEDGDFHDGYPTCGSWWSLFRAVHARAAPVRNRATSLTSEAPWHP